MIAEVACPICQSLEFSLMFNTERELFITCLKCKSTTTAPIMQEDGLIVAFPADITKVEGETVN